MNIVSTIESSTLILTECAISERLRRRTDIKLHPILFNTPLIYDRTGRRHLQEIYGGYREIALRAGLPILLCAPTWRVDQERIRAAGFDPSIIQDAVKFMKELESLWQHQDSPLFTGALIAPKNDCYSPDDALSREEAAAYHSWQAEKLAETDAAVIIAQTMPAICEALGMADALGQTNVPYIISFVADRHGCVLDTTPLPEAIETIDNEVTNPPLGYMVNCVYPTFLCASRQSPGFFKRMIGIQANASSKDHDQLDNSESLQQDPLTDWGRQMLELNRKFGVKILGGCCGTDDTYLRYLTEAGTR